jgi:hypothetical protein
VAVAVAVVAVVVALVDLTTTGVAPTMALTAD